MTRGALPMLGIVLSLSAMVVAFVARPVDQPEAGTLEPRLGHIRQRVRDGDQFAAGEGAFVGQASQRVDRAEQAASGLDNAIQPPSDQDLRTRAGELIDANWPVFVQRYLFASGRIGVLSPDEQRTARALGARQGDELRRLGLSQEQQKKAEPVVGEVIVLLSKARHMLRQWPHALDIERSRIFDAAHKKLRASVPPGRADILRKWMEEKFK